MLAFFYFLLARGQCSQAPASAFFLMRADFQFFNYPLSNIHSLFIYQDIKNLHLARNKPLCCHFKLPVGTFILPVSALLRFFPLLRPKSQTKNKIRLPKSAYFAFLLLPEACYSWRLHINKRSGQGRNTHILA